MIPGGQIELGRSFPVSGFKDQRLVDEASDMLNSTWSKTSPEDGGVDVAEVDRTTG